jgi:hypothetical protein
MVLITKKIFFIISGFLILLGIILFIHNIGIIPQSLSNFVINLWPLILIICGVLVLIDTLKKREFSRKHSIKEKLLALPQSEKAVDQKMKISFSYGKFTLLSSNREQQELLYDETGPVNPPKIDKQIVGKTLFLKILKTQPLFPAYFQLRNNWYMRLLKDVPLQLDLKLHEADLLLDLRELTIENLNIKAGYGVHNIFFGKTNERIRGSIYSSSTLLSINIPHNVFLQLKLFNPFCHMEYPQGDFRKRDDGSIISSAKQEYVGTIELTIDGPLRQISIDIEGEEEE